jgi:uncharacterized lipoprotein YmbA
MLALLLCAACIQLGAETQPQTYFLLNGDLAPPGTSSGDKLTLAIKIIDFPGFLDRKRIVVRNQDNQIKVADASWAEPLQENLLRVLRQNLSTHWPAAIITLSPWEQSRPQALQLELLINRFSGTLEQSVTVDIDWRIKKDGTPLDQGHFRETIAIDTGYQGYVAGLNQGITLFSQRLIRALADR